MNRPPKTKFIVALGGVLLATSASLAHAAGLGKLSVNSALGQPLLAEIELVSLQPGEFESIAARVASPESYGEARIEYSPLLRQVRFATTRRADGRAVLRITSNAPINEPFLDVLVEVTWPSGRLVREYPILLDPPGFAEMRQPPAVPVAAVPAAPAVEPPAAATPAVPEAPIVTPVPSAAIEAPLVSSVPGSSTRVEAPLAAGEPPPVAVGEPPAAPGASPAAPLAAPPAPGASPAAPGAGPAARAASPDSYGPVESGDTLNEIASVVKHDSVSLEQMLVALYRENKGAFINNNMNLLKTGQILRVPSADQAGKIAQGEARKEISVQVADWKNYREQLAGAVASSAAKPATESNESSGKISVAKPDKPAPTAAPVDQLKIAKMDAAGKAGSAGAKGGAQEQMNALKEEAIARDNQLKEANSRVVDLEKQVQTMRKLIELKGSAPAGKTADGKAADGKTADAKTATPSKAAEPVKPADTKAAPADTKAAPAPAKAEPAKPAVKTPDAVAPDGKAPPAGTEAKPAAPKADVKPPVKAAPAAAPAAEPSLLDLVQENAVLIAAGVSVLLAGLVLFLMRRKKKPYGSETSQILNTSSVMPSDLKPNTITGNRSGGLVDTGNSSFLTDFDKTGPGSIDTDEVDPVAEAEVYIAYGRDAQAEEILKEAMHRDKSRHEIALKLLEIYHARKSAQAFETVARELKGAVGASHPMWAKAAAMGASIDPGNSLYGGQAYAATGVYAAGGASMLAAGTAERPPAPPDLDFDLGFADSAASPTAASRPIDITSPNSGQPAGGGMDFDLDLNSSPVPAAPAARSGGLDFDLGMGAKSGGAPSAAPAAATSFDFDLSALSLDAPSPSAPKADFSAPAASAPAMSLGDLSLDLDIPGDTGTNAAATKLELAKAYIEIGDSDGAKEILTEVTREGSAAQQDEAKKILAGI